MGGTLQCLGLKQILCELVHVAVPGSAAGWSMSCAVQWQLPWHRGHTLVVPLGRCSAVHARNYYWVWFSSVLSGDCE